MKVYVTIDVIREKGGQKEPKTQEKIKEYY